MKAREKLKGDAYAEVHEFAAIADADLAKPFETGVGIEREGASSEETLPSAFRFLRGQQGMKLLESSSEHFKIGKAASLERERSQLWGDDASLPDDEGYVSSFEKVEASSERSLDGHAIESSDHSVAQRQAFKPDEPGSFPLEGSGEMPALFEAEEINRDAVSNAGASAPTDCEEAKKLSENEKPGGPMPPQGLGGKAGHTNQAKETCPGLTSGAIGGLAKAATLAEVPSDSIPADAKGTKDSNLPAEAHANVFEGEEIGCRSASGFSVDDRKDLNGKRTSEPAGQYPEYGDQAFDAIAAGVARRDQEAFCNFYEADELVGAQNSGDANATARHDDPCSADEDDRGSSSNPNPASPESLDDKQDIQQPAEELAESNSEQKPRLQAARILAAGLLVGTCVFASGQLGIPWLEAGVVKIRPHFLHPPPSPKAQASGGESSIATLGEGDAKIAQTEFGAKSVHGATSELDYAHRAFGESKSTQPASSSRGAEIDKPEYIAKPGSRLAAMHQAIVPIPGSSNGTAMEMPETGDTRAMPAAAEVDESGYGVETAEVEAETISDWPAIAEGMRTPEPARELAERRDDPEASVSFSIGPSIPHSADVRSAAVSIDDLEITQNSSPKAGSRNHSNDWGQPERSAEIAQRMPFPESDRCALDNTCLILLSEDITDAALGVLGEKTGDIALGSGPISEANDYLKPAELDSLRTEIELEMDDIRSRLSLLATILDNQLARNEAVSSYNGKENASKTASLKSHSDAHSAGERACGHSRDQSDRDCDGSSQARTSQPYLIATAENAADSEAAKPKQGYGVVRNILRDSAGGWLIVMEHATLRLD